MLEEQRSQFQYFCETIEERASSFSSNRFTEETYFFFFPAFIFARSSAISQFVFDPPKHHPDYYNFKITTNAIMLIIKMQICFCNKNTAAKHLVYCTMYHGCKKQIRMATEQHNNREKHKGKFKKKKRQIGNQITKRE